MPSRTDPESPFSITAHEHALHALIDLGRELTIALDPYRTVELLLLSVMGQMGTSRAAVWLLPDGTRGPCVLVGQYGFGRAMATELGEIFASSLAERFGPDPTPLTVDGVLETLGAGGSVLRQARIALIAPLWVQGAALGLVAIGSRPDGVTHGVIEVKALQASLAIASLSLHTGSMVNRLIESRRLLSLANDDLRQLDRMKSEFLSNINHELRTPLTVILASMECALTAAPDSVEMLIQNSLEEARRLRGLLENLLTLSDASRDELSTTVSESDAASFVARCHFERHPGVVSALRILQLEQERPHELAWFDEQRVRQILDALIDNAIKFTPPGSTITLRTRLEMWDGVPWVRIEVSDNGPGVPADRVPALFAPFRQLDGSSTRRQGGMGIGLALARRLAEAMGGRLELDPGTAAGATFALYLPTLRRPLLR